MPALVGNGLPPLDSAPAATSKPVRVWKRRTDRPAATNRKIAHSVPSSTTTTPLRANFPFIPKPRHVSETSARSARSTQSAQSSRSRRSQWSGKSGKSGRSVGSRLSSHSHKGYRLPPLDLHHPLSKLAEALDLANISAPSAKERRATKAALALRQLILDPPQFELCAVALPSALTGLAPVGAAAAAPKSKTGKMDTPAVSNTLTTVGTKGKKSFVPRLREKDVSRLRTQLLKPTEAKMVIAHARSLPVAEKLSNNDRAVCLNCPEDEADTLIEEAHRIEGVRRKEEERLDRHRFSTIKAAPQPPPRLPVLLSLFSGLTAVGAMPGTGIDASITMLGLFEPASAMSLHRPLAGALPSAETLRRGFDALINAESKVYMYNGPSHRNIHPPTDRMSVYTYWWGFELALPPATMKYLAHAKSIATSVLNLLSVIVYAVPGGTRELAPFVGVLSRFIDNEWALLKSQDQGKGVVCGATWFIPAALTARPWDFGEETIRDRIIAEEEKELLEKEPIDPSAIVKITGPKGEEEQAVVVGVGKGVVKGKRSSPVIPWKPGTPKTGLGSADRGQGGSGKEKKGAKGGDKDPIFTVPGAPKSKPIELPDDDQKHEKPSKGKQGDGFEMPIPPDIPVMPIFAVQGSISSSAPASPARTTPPTPARAKFGWRHKAFIARPGKKGKDENTDKAAKVDAVKVGKEKEESLEGKGLKGILRPAVQVAVSSEVTEVIQAGDDVQGQDVTPGGETDYADLAPLDILPDDELEEQVGNGEAPCESGKPPSTTLAGGAVPETSTTPQATGTVTPIDLSSYTLMSRTMRRVVGTLGRMRASIPYSLPPNDGSHRIDPYPLSPADMPGTPSAYQYTDIAAANTQTTRSQGKEAVGPRHSTSQGGQSKKRGLLPWSFHLSGAQTVRESKRASRVTVPVRS